ncbi:hypothetical protein [Paracidovorax wautersii]|uniref:Uncharacterized protein n=1 Tax=Paracidovorax wautersii TaxID=1177982 RepID=A0A1I2GCM7_9BURK|nr:hypothetical protein [Paracidovorax wautersii]SFF14948.1 hypothetical protein SAMN04489711_11475 [Paracidovorax wautersii]
MGVKIKDLSATIELKNNGMELEVRTPDGTFKGDLVITKTGLIWCEGKTQRANGTKISWDKFVKLVDGDGAAKKAPAKKAAAPKPEPIAPQNEGKAAAKKAAGKVN